MLVLFCRPLQVLPLPLSTSLLDSGIHRHLLQAPLPADFWVCTMGGGSSRRQEEKEVRVFTPQSPSLRNLCWLQDPSTQLSAMVPSPHSSRPVTSPRYYTVPWDFPSCCHTSGNSPLMKSSSNDPMSVPIYCLPILANTGMDSRSSLKQDAGIGWIMASRSTGGASLQRGNAPRCLTVCRGLTIAQVFIEGGMGRSTGYCIVVGGRWEMKWLWLFVTEAWNRLAFEGHGGHVQGKGEEDVIGV